MKSLFKFVLYHRHTVSLNVWQRAHWAKRKEINETWFYEVKVFLANNRIEINPETRKEVHIRSYRKKLCDIDNFIGGLKPVIDALVKNKVLKDDSPEWMVLEVFQEKDIKMPRTEIEVYG